MAKRGRPVGSGGGDRKARIHVYLPPYLREWAERQPGGISVTVARAISDASGIPTTTRAPMHVIPLEDRDDRYARRIRNGGYHTKAEWEALKAQYDYRCVCCRRREPGITLTEDHIVPISRGGRDDIDQIQPLCGLCNNRKGTRIIDYRPSFHGDRL